MPDRLISIDGQTQFPTPKHSIRALAPERCVTAREVPAPGMIEIVGRDLHGKIRFRIEVERDDIMLRWWFKVARYCLATFFGASEIRLIG